MLNKIIADNPLYFFEDAGFALYTQFGIFGKRFQTKVLGG